jgi:tetratricopeptide (TPR) repeat protein
MRISICCNAKPAKPEAENADLHFHCEAGGPKTKILTAENKSCIALQWTHPYMRRFSSTWVRIFLAVSLLAPAALSAQSAQDEVASTKSELPGATLRGVVRDPEGHIVVAATVSLQATGEEVITGHTDLNGAYSFSAIHTGSYTLGAEKEDVGKTSVGVVNLETRKSRTIDLTLERDKTTAHRNPPTPPAFFDEPHFTVAGVTDTTNLGGHGSDTIIRNREVLAAETAALRKEPSAGPLTDSSNAALEKSLHEAVSHQPEGFEPNAQLGKFLIDEARPKEGLPYLERASKLKPSDFNNAYELALAYASTGDYTRARTTVRSLLADQSDPEKAELYHLLAEVEEKSGDSLSAVRDYQRAAELNPSEPNLFDWGVELLRHHAAEPAIQVFTKGSRLFPRSMRMLTGLGAAFYSLGSYDLAVNRVCDASDLDPKNPAPYLFLGKMQAAENESNPVVTERLARFANLQPENPLANYYYAVSLWQSRKSPDDVANVNQMKSLLEKAVRLDPKLGLAYLQLGILYSEQKDFSKAISAYNEAIQATPDLEQAHYRLSQTYRQAGEADKARAELEIYQKISAEKSQQGERQRHEIQQFVYQLRDRSPASPPQ